MEKVKSFMTKLHVVDNEDDDGESLIYWKGWTSTGDQTETLASRYIPQSPRRDESHSLHRRGARRRHNNHTTRRSHRQSSVQEEYQKPDDNSQDYFGNQKKSSSFSISDEKRAARDHAPPNLSIPRTSPLLDWAASPLTPLSMTTSLNRRTMGTISEDEALSIMRVPEIMVTPPTPVLGGSENDQADRRGNGIRLNSPVVTGHEVFDAETERQRDMLRREWVEYVWGDWMGDDEVDEYFQD